MKDLASFEQRIGISFQSPELLKQALVHSSYINENPGFVPASNERLEFLGDAVLGLIITEELYRACPDCPEGELTRLRSVLVRQETLAHHALEIHLNEYLYLGRGEEAGGGRLKPLNLAGALEAVIAAIFLDRGMATSRQFVMRLLERRIQDIIGGGKELDYKSKLQEIIQAKYQLKPVYTVIEARGPDHDRTFTVEVKAGEIMLGKGTGKNKKAAETAAARSALVLFNQPG